VGVVFWIVEIPTTLEKMGSRPMLEQVLLEHSDNGLGVTPNVQEIRELIKAPWNNNTW
jgi:hypothetical protein